MAHPSWGSGWPNCQTSKIDTRFGVDTTYGRTRFPGGVRVEIAELVTRLVKETDMRGYRFGRPNDASYGCWGFACRPIRGSNSPSNHSWGLAVDINAPTNPMGSTLITDMPGWMPDLWNAYGFRWGGDYKNRPDAMHYEFLGTVADAQRLTGVARTNKLGEPRGVPPKPVPPEPEPEPVQEDEKVLAYIKVPSGPAYLTDWLTKRHVATQADADLAIYFTKLAGGKIACQSNSRPFNVNAQQEALINTIPDAS